MRAMTARQSDAQLVQEVRAGSVRALGELYERHADAAYRAAYRILASSAGAEDVVQSLFVGLSRALATYEERGTFEAWLRRVAVHSALMVRRRDGRSVPLDDVAGQEALALAEGSSRRMPDPIRRIAVERSIAALPDPLRIVFMLREVDGYTHREIGDLLGISATASAIRLHRAWKQIRREW